jgi:hypothetical protein
MALEFLALLGQIPDPRRGQGQKWKLPPVLLATILAILSGATSYRKIHRFIETHRSRLNEAFGFGWKKAPAYSAIRFILQERTFTVSDKRSLRGWTAPRWSVSFVSMGRS